MDGNLSHGLLEKGEEVLFAFEEAIGFVFGATVLDKDGVSGAAVTGEISSYLLLQWTYILFTVGRHLFIIWSNCFKQCFTQKTKEFDGLRKDMKK